MNSYLELMRPYNGILAVLGIIIGVIVAGPIIFTIIIAIIVAFLINGAGNVINDYFDYKIDKVNRPKGPIPSGKIGRKSVLVYFFVLIIISLTLSYFVSMDFLYIAAINCLVSFVYSWKLKGTPLVGNMAVSWLAASTFIAGGLVYYGFNTIPAAVLILGLIAFLGTLSREIFKDIEDVKGDKKFGAKTLPIMIGEKGAGVFASVILIISMISLFLPLYFMLFGLHYLIGMIPALVICLLAMLAKNPHKSQKLIKISMYFIFLGFVLGTLL